MEIGTGFRDLENLLAGVLHRVAPDEPTFEMLRYAASGLLVLVLVYCLIRELRIPWRRFPRRSLVRSYVANLGTFLLNDTVLSLLSLPSLLVIAQNFSGQGLLNGMPDGWAKGLLCFILLDFVMYLWHAANHHCDWLWRFHKVHHSDTTLNVTTGLRFHFGELVLTVLLKAVFIVVVGVGAEVVVINEIILTGFVLFHHMNSSPRGERLWSLIFIMPRQHRLHHSARREEHDHNYGGALALWDRLFGTLREGEPERIGLYDVGEQDILGMIRFGLITRYGQPNHSTLLPAPVRPRRSLRRR
jgi:sterol desaturase/sphingolipid hydroxylase (fatty acid hydroxylase superfamily)